MTPEGTLMKKSSHGFFFFHRDDEGAHDHEIWPQGDIFPFVDVHLVFMYCRKTSSEHVQGRSGHFFGS